MSIMGFSGMPDTVVGSKCILDVAQLPKSKMAATQNPSKMKMCITFDFDGNVVEGRFWCLLWSFRYAQHSLGAKKTFLMFLSYRTPRWPPN